MPNEDVLVQIIYEVTVPANGSVQAKQRAWESLVRKVTGWNDDGVFTIRIIKDGKDAHPDSPDPYID